MHELPIDEQSASGAECVFCKIARHQMPAEILYETNNVVAILDINPIHYGHALVIPKAHCVDLLHVRESDLHDVLHATQVVARAIVGSLKLDGFNIFSNNGRIAGQSVFHFHMHITPRYPSDNIHFVLELKSYSGNAMTQYAENIRKHILQ
jgi:histidine triad (HIT) family protein